MQYAAVTPRMVEHLGDQSQPMRPSTRKPRGLKVSGLAKPIRGPRPRLRPTDYPGTYQMGEAHALSCIVFGTPRLAQLYMAC